MYADEKVRELEAEILRLRKKIQTLERSIALLRRRLPPGFKPLGSNQPTRVMGKPLSKTWISEIHKPN